MMALDLGTVFGLARPMLAVLAAPAVLVAFWASFVTFRVAGRDYQSKAMAAAVRGFTMGAAATAIANTQALARRHAPAPRAFLIVPIVGAFFIDLINAVVPTLLLSLDPMGFKLPADASRCDADSVARRPILVDALRLI
jgi:glutamate:Na+ symporter, ESS family